MQSYTAACALMAAVALGLAGHASQQARAQPVPQPSCAPAAPATSGNPQRLVSADNGFGFRLFQDLVGLHPQANTFISPVSAGLALDMTYGGARGGTEQAMARALGLGSMKPAETGRQAAALLSALRGADPKVTLNIANSLWAHQGIPLRGDFLLAARQRYGARVTSLDFNSPAAVGTINNWVSCATHSTIKQIITQIRADEVLLLLNATYFKGPWADPFIPSQTKPAPFTAGGGRQLTVPLMHVDHSFAYYQNTDFQEIRLPYGSGRFGMVVVLPRRGLALSTLTRRLSLATWKSWTAHLHGGSAHPVDLAMPHLTLQDEQNLVPPLKAFGMGIAFVPRKADFSGMCAEDLKCFITRAFQKTYLKVDELGTTAAAVTGVGVGAASVPVGAPVHMIVDHPFLLAIQDDTTGSVLFLGAISAPS